MRWSFPILALVLAAAPARADDRVRPTIELRHTPFFERPYHAPGLGALLAYPLTDHWWVGGGYELIQDYDAMMWTSKNTIHKPVVMSGIRLGTWYRGGAAEQGMSWAAGPLVTFAVPALSLARSPNGLEAGTYAVDLGADFSIGRVWNVFRLEAYATPAWSVGNVASPAVGSNERINAFTYRLGLALAVRLGS